MKFVEPAHIDVKGIDWNVPLSDGNKINDILNAVSCRKTKEGETDGKDDWVWIDVLCVRQDMDRRTMSKARHGSTYYE